MNGYSEALTRGGLDGALDKLVLVETLSDRYAEDREFHEAVLQILRGCPSDADEQVKAWEAYCDALPYRREANEVFRDPKQSLEVGGDCDDLVLLFLSGCKALGLPCVAEIVADEEGWAFHIRALVGLPPTAPQGWVVVDPVWRSERQWAMDGKGSTGSTYMQSKQMQGMVVPAMNGSPLHPPSPSSPSMSGALSSSKSRPLNVAMLLATGLAVWIYLRQTTTSKRR